MPRLNLTNLPRPVGRYLLNRAPVCQRTGHRFETLDEARAEDLTRARLLAKTCRDIDLPLEKELALELAGRLENSALGAEHNTPASKVYMGRMRFCIGGALWRLVDGSSHANTFTVIPRGWIYSAGELANVDPRNLLNAFRSALMRKGAGSASGYVCGHGCRSRV